MDVVTSTHNARHTSTYAQVINASWWCVVRPCGRVGAVLVHQQKAQSLLKPDAVFEVVKKLVQNPSNPVDLQMALESVKAMFDKWERACGLHDDVIQCA